MIQEILKKEKALEEECEKGASVSGLIGYYNYTVVLTYIGMLVGFMGIVFASANKTSQAIVCLMVSGLCDMFDGAIASTRQRTKQEKRFGVQIDSLSDLICFGVLPACITVSNNKAIVSVIICGFYILTALIRLAYYNVDEEERQNNTTDRRKIYLGLPVTSIALLYPIIFLKYGINNSCVIYPVLLAVVGIAFVVPFKLKKCNLVGEAILTVVGIIVLIKLLTGIL